MTTEVRTEELRMQGNRIATLAHMADLIAAEVELMKNLLAQASTPIMPGFDARRATSGADDDSAPPSN